MYFAVTMAGVVAAKMKAKKQMEEAEKEKVRKVYCVMSFLLLADF